MCVRPLVIRNPKLNQNSYDPEFISVPCGRCFECQQSLSNDWRTRCEFHCKDYLSKGFDVYYYTLTFNDQHLPRLLLNDGTSVPCFDRRLVQLFFKRLKKLLYSKYKLTFTHIISSEYGDTYGRPHHHVLFFLDGNLSPFSFKNAVRFCWSEHKYKYFGFGKNRVVKLVSSSPYGFVKEGDFNGKVQDRQIPCQYVTKYISKHYNEKVSSYIRTNIVKAVCSEKDAIRSLVPFHFQSVGFGLSIMNSSLTDWNTCTCSYYDHVHETFVTKSIPLYIIRKYYYDKYINDNGNISYRLNDKGIKLRLSQLDMSISKFVLKLESLKYYNKDHFSHDDFLSSFFTNSSNDFNFASFIETKVESFELLAEHKYLYRYRYSAPSPTDRHQYFLDTHIDTSLYPFDRPSYDDYDSVCHHYDKLLQFIDRIFVSLRYPLYVKRVEDYNSQQRLRYGREHKTFNPVDIMTFQQYLSNSKY